MQRKADPNVTRLDAAVLEKGPIATEIDTSTTAVAQSDVIIVSWDEPSDPSNPYNWSASRKWFTTLLTSLGGLITLMSGPMLAPALDVIGKEMHMSQAEASIALSIYIVAFAFGPMVLAPCSEVWGRRPIWIIGGTWYVLWNTICGLSSNRGLLIAGRLLSGMGASAEFAVSGAIVADCFTSAERGRSTAARSFLPLLGPAVGPILGGVMVQKVSWRWLFYVLSIFAACLVILFLLFLPETHAQTILSRRAAELRKTTGKPYYAEQDVSNLQIAAKLKITTLRPAIMLCTQPVVQLAALLMGYQFGLLYIVHSTFANMWLEQYHQSYTASGLHYFAPVTGCLIALVIEWWAVDAIWARLKARNGGIAKPENRVPLMVPGSLLVPIGILVYGWSVETHLHWIVPDLGIGIFSCGYLLSTTAVQTYIVEAFLNYTASGAAASQLPRNIFAFTFPIFAPTLFSSMGYGYGNTLLAGIAIILGIPAPYILWKYGERMRLRGGAIG